MRNINITKLILDIIMTAVFLILIDPKNTGMAFHEIAGLTMGALFTFHIILNWTWVKSITKNLLNPKLKTKTKAFYIINAVSFISVMTIIVTGIEISQVLFVSEAAGFSEGFYNLHKWVSYFCLGLFAVHIALHWRFIIETMRNSFAALKAPALGKAVMSMGAIVLMAGLLYSQIASSATDYEDQSRTGRESYDYRREAYQSETNEDQDNTNTTESGVNYDYSPDANNNISADRESNDQADQNNTILPDTDNIGNSVTLTDYLGKMFCNGCHKHCSLLNLQCNRGFQQLEDAKYQYQQQYEDISVN
ncbi:MAG: DUF4405 domain-containing protein [Syntrophomonas sp.]